MENIERVLQLYSEGHSVRAIGQILGQSHQYAYRRLKKVGAQIRKSHGHRFHKQWRGGRTMHDGYVRMRVASDDPFAVMQNHQGYVLEHRYVMARHLGRPLLATETVHHINAINPITELRTFSSGRASMARISSCAALTAAHTGLGQYHLTVNGVTPRLTTATAIHKGKA